MNKPNVDIEIALEMIKHGKRLTLFNANVVKQVRESYPGADNYLDSCPYDLPRKLGYCMAYGYTCKEISKVIGRAVTKKAMALLQAHIDWYNVELTKLCK